MVVKGEGLSRLLAERRLVRLYKEEYERLAKRRGHVEALRSLVKTHKDRYNAIVQQARSQKQKWPPPRTPEAGTDRVA